MAPLEKLPGSIPRGLEARKLDSSRLGGSIPGDLGLGVQGLKIWDRGSYGKASTLDS